MRTDTIGNHATTITIDDATTKITYHQTVVVEWDEKTVTLNSGGYRTRTTQLRINQASEQFGLGFRIRQQNREWIVEVYNGQRTPHVLDFSDNMILTR